MTVLFTRDRAPRGIFSIRRPRAASGGHVPADPAQRLYFACNPLPADAAAQLRQRPARVAAHHVDRARFAYRSYWSCAHCTAVNPLRATRCDGCGAAKPARGDRR